LIRRIVMNLMSKRNTAKALSAAVTGFITGKPVDPSRTTAVGHAVSCSTAALKNSGSAHAALAAGGVAVAAKAAVVTAAVTAAAPVVAAGAVIATVGYGVSKLLR
jgi:hypothetical protein